MVLYSLSRFFVLNRTKRYFLSVVISCCYHFIRKQKNDNIFSFFFFKFFSFFHQESLHLKRNQAKAPATIIKTFKLFSCEVETALLRFFRFFSLLTTCVSLCSELRSGCCYDGFSVTGFSVTGFSVAVLRFNTRVG